MGQRWLQSYRITVTHLKFGYLERVPGRGYYYAKIPLFLIDYKKNSTYPVSLSGKVFRVIGFFWTSYANSTIKMDLPYKILSTTDNCEVTLREGDRS